MLVLFLRQLRFGAMGGFICSGKGTNTAMLEAVPELFSSLISHDSGGVRKVEVVVLVEYYYL